MVSFGKLVGRRGFTWLKADGVIQRFASRAAAEAEATRRARATNGNQNRTASFRHEARPLPASLDGRAMNHTPAAATCKGRNGTQYRRSVHGWHTTSTGRR